ncbi:dentin sialophosphoprotein-like isoform X1 [Pseudomyrmex gracilis]|uniref:dentin sialophosphoprotein-like isoform X1 n=1 Tax=Pseudomyrmex gracilis TaxID=219809 RepID=UPI000995679E|nr:dentin sialophosphoprotein-like isoform X1 [Pseudomyrmex gracilis]
MHEKKDVEKMSKIKNVFVWFTQTSIGYKILRAIDRTLWVAQKCTEWSLPDHMIDTPYNRPLLEGKEYFTLVRPLPWIFFFPSLIFIRSFKMILNCYLIMFGYPRVTELQIVNFIRYNRQYITRYARKSANKIEESSKEDKRLPMNEVKQSLIRSIRLTLSSLSCLDSKLSASPPPTKIHVGSVFDFKPIVKTLPEKPDSSDSDSSDSESLDSDSSDSDSLDSKSVVDEAAIPTNSAKSIEESNKTVSDPKNTDEQDSSTSEECEEDKNLKSEDPKHNYYSQFFPYYIKIQKRNRKYSKMLNCFGTIRKVSSSDFESESESESEKFSCIDGLVYKPFKRTGLIPPSRYINLAGDNSDKDTEDTDDTEDMEDMEDTKTIDLIELFNPNDDCSARTSEQDSKDNSEKNSEQTVFEQVTEQTFEKVHEQDLECSSKHASEEKQDTEDAIKVSEQVFEHIVEQALNTEASDEDKLDWKLSENWHDKSEAERQLFHSPEKSNQEDDVTFYSPINSDSEPKDHLTSPLIDEKSFTRDNLETSKFINAEINWSISQSSSKIPESKSSDEIDNSAVVKKRSGNVSKRHKGKRSGHGNRKRKKSIHKKTEKQYRERKDKE